MPKLTAETITDEQIRELRDAAQGVDWDTYRIASQALEWVNHARSVAEKACSAPLTLDQAQIHILGEYVLGRRWERARCAEILNARAAEEK